METDTTIDDEEISPKKAPKPHAKEFDDGVKSCILKNIDVPSNRRLSIKPLFDNAYRVNIWTPIDVDGCMLTNWTISGSYFVKVEKTKDGFEFTDMTANG